MNIRPLESLTKEELIELIRHERDHSWQPLTMAPEGWKLAPVDPTYDMTQAGVNLALSARISGAYPWPTYIRDMYKAMLAAAPQPGHIPDAGKMVVSDRSMKEIKAALAGSKGKEHTLIFSAKEVRGLLNTIVNQNQRIERFEKKIADRIAQDRKMPTDTEMLDWLIEKEALICHSVTDNLYEIWFDIDNVETGKTAREAITKAMRGEK